MTQPRGVHLRVLARSRRLAWFWFVGLFVVPLPVHAGPATHLLIDIPPLVCAEPCFPVTVEGVDQVFPLFVEADDAMNNPDTGYAGTVTFTSTDPRAMLPSNYTFIPGQGWHLFLDAAILRTPGSQTLTVRDTANPAITGTWTVTVLSPSAPIPVSTPLGTLAFVALLAVGGTWLVSRHS